MKVYIGIDIGQTGGLAALKNSEVIEVIKTPQKQNKDIDVVKIKEFIKKHNPDFVMVEHSQSIYGTSSKANFNFGRNFGVILGVIEGDFSYEMVKPRVWQKEIWSSSDKVFVIGSKVNTKKTSLNSAKRLFPKESFLATKRSKKPHDGMVDAALIALYAERKNL